MFSAIIIFSGSVTWKEFEASSRLAAICTIVCESLRGGFSASVKLAWEGLLIRKEKVNITEITLKHILCLNAILLLRFSLFLFNLKIAPIRRRRRGASYPYIYLTLFISIS